MESTKRQLADNCLNKRCNEYKSALDDATRNYCEMAKELDKTRKGLQQGLDHEARSRQDENVKMGGALTRLQEALDGEVSDCQQGLADCVDRVKMVSENLTRESKARAAGDDESSRLLVAVRQAIEKETKERAGAELEMERLTRELSATIEQEKNNRERDDAALKNQAVGLLQELAREMQEHASVIAICTRGLATLEGQQKELRDSIELEASERIAASERVDRTCIDLRVSLEADRVAQNATTNDLERAITKNQRANEVEIRDRTTSFEEHTRNFIALRQEMSNIRTEVVGEKEERVNDVSDLRNVLKSYDQKLTNQFKDFKLGLEYESGERLNSNERLEKRFIELRGAVLVAVRGPGMR